MGNLHLIDDYAWTLEDFKTSQTMQGYFANFIKTGNPNANGLPQWDPAKPKDQKPPVMVIDTQSKQIHADQDARYLFLDKEYGN